MIESKRFYLRKFVKEDASMMFNNWASDPEVTKYLTWNPHQDIKVTNEYLNFIIESNQMNFAIVIKETKEVIGAISIVKENEDFSICEVGYCLSRKHWNQGVMTEVLNAYLKYLFETLNYQMVTAYHMKENISSGRVMLKAGMKYDYTDDVLFDKFGWVTVYYYSISKEEYLMKKIQNEIGDFFNTKVPIFSNVDNLMKYLENNGYLMKKITLIDTSKIILNQSELVFTTSIKCENIVNYYFLSRQNTRKSFKNYLDIFLLDNKEYIICDNDKSIEQILVNLLKKYHLTISFAESCTGGLMASSIVNISGASDVIKESYVTYSEESKMKILNVSKQTALEMAKGLKFVTDANICVSITGLAGSNVPTANDGSYHSAIIINCLNKEQIIEFKKTEKGIRNSVRNKQKNYIFYQIIKALESLF